MLCNETNYGARTLLTSGVGGPIQPSFCLVDDRLLLVANTEKALRRFLDLHDQGPADNSSLRRTSNAGSAGREDTPRVRALRKALDTVAESHHLVVAIAPPPGLVSQLKAFQPAGQPSDIWDLLSVHSVVLTVDQSRRGKGEQTVDEVKAHVRATYEDERQAEVAGKAANRLLQDAVARATHALGNDIPATMLNKLLQPLRGDPVRGRGAEVHLPYELAFSNKEAQGWVEQTRQIAAEANNANNLRNLALAFRAYHDIHRHFPAAASYSPDGKPLLSWRVAILPYIEQGELYHKFKLDKPWDDPDNLKLLDQMPKMFALPALAKTPFVPPPADGGPALSLKNATHFQVFVGPGAAFEGKRGLGLTDFRADADNVFLIVEAADPVLWTKPADLSYDPTKPIPKLGNWYGKGFQAAMADTQVRSFVGKVRPPEALDSYIRRQPARQP